MTAPIPFIWIPGRLGYRNPTYSCRKATTGSTREARRAGP